MKHHRYGKAKHGNWRNDLSFVFNDGILERAVIINNVAQTPLIVISILNDIERFFLRVGLKDFFCEHMYDLENMPREPTVDEEIRMFREFTYGFTVLETKRKYIMFCGVWYFKNIEHHLDASFLVGISPAGMEGMVQAEVDKILASWRMFLSSDATFSMSSKGEKHNLVHLNQRIATQ